MGRVDSGLDGKILILALNIRKQRNLTLSGKSRILLVIALIWEPVFEGEYSSLS